MLDLRCNHLLDLGTLFYFDPDIIVKCDWKFLEQWAETGIALCEDINSPMSSTHPIRAMWDGFYRPHGFAVARALDV